MASLLYNILAHKWSVDIPTALEFEDAVDMLLSGDKDAIRLLIGSPDEQPKPMFAWIEGSGNDAGVVRYSEEGWKADNDSVALIDLQGMLFKESDWCTTGTTEMASMLKQAYETKNIVAAILRFDTPGGTTDSVIPLENTLRELRGKFTTVSAVDSRMLSAGMYLGSFASKIYATHKMAEIGSIGVMQVLKIDKERNEKNGVKVQYIVPPESKDKNRGYLKALEGDTSLLKEELSEWAKHFQGIIKENRKNLNSDIAGTLTGKTFSAQKIMENKNGLIDGIMPFDKIVAKAYEMGKRRKNGELIIH